MPFFNRTHNSCSNDTTGNFWFSNTTSDADEVSMSMIFIFSHFLFSVVTIPSALIYLSMSAVAVDSSFNCVEVAYALPMAVQVEGTGLGGR